jgi:hypothetical protein
MRRSWVQSCIECFNFTVGVRSLAVSDRKQTKQCLTQLNMKNPTLVSLWFPLTVSLAAMGLALAPAAGREQELDNEWVTPEKHLTFFPAKQQP